MAEDTANPQPVSSHGATSMGDQEVTYSKYVTGEVQSLQDQADNGGWTFQGMPVGGDAPVLDSRMGTRGGFKQATDYHSEPDSLQPE